MKLIPFLFLPILFIPQRHNPTYIRPILQYRTFPYKMEKVEYKKEKHYPMFLFHVSFFVLTLGVVK